MFVFDFFKTILKKGGGGGGGNGGGWGGGGGGSGGAEGGGGSGGGGWGGGGWKNLYEKILDKNCLKTKQKYIFLIFTIFKNSENSFALILFIFCTTNKFSIIIYK